MNRRRLSHFHDLGLRERERNHVATHAAHRDAIAESRELKPAIPEIGKDGVPIRHELEFERRLTDLPVSG